MTTDITELALLVSKAKASVFTLEYISQFEPADIDSDDVDLRFEVDGRDTGTNVSIVDECGQAAKVIVALVEALEKAQQHIARQEQILLNQDESLSIRRGELEAAQQERDNWRASFDNERFRADKLKAHIDDIEPIRAAAEKLVRCKGRYHSEQNYRALAALFGVTTPDLPPIDGESRTVKLPQRLQPGADGWDDWYVHSDDEGEYLKFDDVLAMLTAAGIKWEAE